MIKRKANLSNLLKETLDAYYWIGFLLADGCIDHSTKRLILGLAESDIDHIFKFSKFIESDTKEKRLRVACQDKETVPKIINKFDFKHRKTYNPPVKKLPLNNKLIALYIGFIDGDGSIRNVTNRKDSYLAIKIHSSWLKWLKELELNIYSFFKIIKFNKKINTKLNSKNYATLILSDSRILTALKKFVIKNRLPVLERKWNVINENFKSRYTIARENRLKIYSLYNLGYSINEICAKLQLKYDRVYMTIRRHG